MMGKKGVVVVELEENFFMRCYFSRPVSFLHHTTKIIPYPLPSLTHLFLRNLSVVNIANPKLLRDAESHDANLGKVVGREGGRDDPDGELAG